LHARSSISRRNRTQRPFHAFTAALLLSAGLSRATETENLNLSVLPKPGDVAIDGQYGDWDLSGGVFACGDAESQRDNYAVWIHAMYDADAVYVLARWIDATPMNNPGTVKGDYGFRGDCLQVRFVTAPDIDSPAVLRIGSDGKDAELMRSSSWDCWIDRDGGDAIGGQYGRNFNEGTIPDPRGNGAAQAFRRHDDGKGYTQEMRIPWKLITKPGLPMQPGSRLLMTVEPNFTVGTTGRLTIKDIFRARSAIDRVFTFRAQACWGVATLEPKGNLPPRTVRLSDGREFAVRMADGLPVVDWTGLIQSRVLEGHKAITFTVPEDGYVSLNLYSPSNTVVRQLLTAAFYTKGEHTAQWDGLTTYSVRVPGTVVPTGTYTPRAIHHKGIGLEFRGWACNGVAAPSDTAAGLDEWGGDHGNPVAAAADGERVYLGWSGAEGGKALVATDLDGSTVWRNLRGGIGSASLLAADASIGPNGTVFAVNRSGQYAPVGIYRLDAKTGRYTEWSKVGGTDLLPKHIWGADKGVPSSPSYLAAGFGTVYASYTGTNRIAVIDGTTGEVRKWLDFERPCDMEVVAPDQLVVASGCTMTRVSVADGKQTPFATVEGPATSWIAATAVDAVGRLYAGLREGIDQIVVFDAQGKQLRTIGKQSRVLDGPWAQDSLANIGGMAVDATGKLWVSEDHAVPRRVSVWNTADGAFHKEFFGAASYGGTGGAVNPVDPNLMVGQGCEWRLDPKTGRAACLGVVGGSNMGVSRFGFSKDGRLFLATTGFRARHPVQLFERLGDGHYIRRAGLWPADAKAKTGIKVWADANGDAAEQEAEVRTFTLAEGMDGWISGWYMSMAPDLSFYGSQYQVRVTDYTACGAPVYDLDKAVRMPTPENMRGRGGMGAERGMGSADGRLMVYNGHYGEDHSTLDCFDIASGVQVWSYPNNFTGVHGSHRAPGPEAGMLRGAYDVCGTAKFPAPLGNLWLVPTNKGEWHILNEDGFYVSHLFQSDPMKWQYPDRMVPGARIDQCPPGAGEEAFGGSMTQAKDGRLFVQVGHTSFWNVEVLGLDAVRAIPVGGPVTVTEADTEKARAYREAAMQASVGTKSVVARQKTVVFTGNVQKDFEGTGQLTFQKNANAGVRAAMAWDKDTLYVGWDVQDATAWVNGADAPEFLYARGDTVDLQLATIAEPKVARAEAGKGDLRLSIGNFQGTPTAVLYRKVAETKKPMTFNSGVVRDYVMESVTVEPTVRVSVKQDKNGYTVEAAIPLALLGVVPGDGLTLRGDLGVTHGNKDGNDTALRTYWNNQGTGIVSDEVFELKMEPRNWGEIVFQSVDALQ
jgi:hypothetical protein